MMDIEREMAATMRRVRKQVDRMGDDALRRIGVDPEAERIARRMRSYKAAGEVLGQSLSALVSAMRSFMGGVDRGYSNAPNHENRNKR